MSAKRAPEVLRFARLTLTLCLPLGDRQVSRGMNPTLCNGSDFKV